MNRHLNPHAVATDERVIGRVRDERATAPTARLPSDDFAELVAALREAATQAERDAARLGSAQHARTLSSLASKWRDVIARVHRSPT